MNADELVDFLLQDDDFTVEVHYEDAEFEAKKPQEGTVAASKRLLRTERPLFTEVDEILKDLEQLIVRPGSCQTYESVRGDDWSNAEENDEVSRRRYARKQQGGSSGAKSTLGDKSRNRTSKQEDIVAGKSKKSGKRKLKKEHETELSPIPRTKSSLTSHKDEHKDLTSGKGQVGMKKHHERKAKNSPHQHEDDFSKKRSRKKKNHHEASPSDETLIQEVTELIETERIKNEHDRMKKVNTSRKSVSRSQAPSEEANNHSSKKLSKKKRMNRQKKSNNDGTAQVTAQDPKEGHTQQVVNQQNGSNSKE
ncbi:hypothetical protein HG537_0D06490 [Torulaspora globosa]|uniref:Uncharacterized protein n=1 Tax=Torulaspora globosa TaxID=48254 RepID=A0A7H9HSE0_9SACH|nr:hypothetical protein HG537_0D06490 [Torulaspora sp. CBS 2947]